MANKTVTAIEELSKINDMREGPLAEARPIAEILFTVAVDRISLGDDTPPVLAQMLLSRMEEITKIVDAATAAANQSEEVAHG